MNECKAQPPPSSLTFTARQTPAKVGEMWAVADVIDWLHSVGLERYETAFRRAAVDGARLLDLDDV